MEQSNFDPCCFVGTKVICVVYIDDLIFWETCGLEQSKFDPCLFIGTKVIYVVYVDDLIFWSKDTLAINDSAMQLRELGVDLEQEDDAAGFLGVTLEQDPETSCSK